MRKAVEVQIKRTAEKVDELEATVTDLLERIEKLEARKKPGPKPKDEQDA